MNLKSATEQLLKNIRKTRFDDLMEIPTAYVENLRKALAEEVNGEQEEVNKDA